MARARDPLQTTKEKQKKRHSTQHSFHNYIQILLITKKHIKEWTENFCINLVGNKLKAQISCKLEKAQKAQQVVSKFYLIKRRTINDIAFRN